MFSPIRGRGWGTIVIIWIVELLGRALSAIGVQTHMWIECLMGGLLASALNAIFAARFCAVEEPKFVIDPTTCEEVQINHPRKDYLLWIPVRYWTYIILAYTVLIVFALLKFAPDGAG